MVYGILIYEFLYHNLSLADFTFALSSTITLSTQFSNFFINYSNLLKCSRQLDDFRLFMMEEKDEKEYLNISDINNYEIVFKNVYFRYYGQENYALENVSFVLKPKKS